MLFSLSSVVYAQDYWSAVTQEKLSLSDDAPLNSFQLDRPAVDAKFSLSNRTAKPAEIKMFFPNEANELEEFSKEPKGELTVVISESNTDENYSKNLSESDINIINKMINKLTIKEITDLICQNSKVSKKLVYNYCLKLKNEN